MLEKAAGELEKNLKSKGKNQPSAAQRECLVSASRAIAEAARVLAYVAVAANPGPKQQKELKDAESNFLAGDFRDAVKEFRGAWDKATK